MDLIPKEVQLKCEEILAAPLQTIENISGGDINIARLIKTKNNSYFLKMNTLAQSLNMFETEAKGLQLINKSLVIKTPEVIHFNQVDGTAFLLLSFIESGHKTVAFWEHFGQSLALLHKENTADLFGLDHNNYIGNLLQYNHFEKDFIDFYIKHRLKPQIRLAVDNNRLESTSINNFESLFKKLDSILPVEPASLCHGDLWSGNFLVNKNEQAVLIDPAVSFSHREMDIAMTYLFGGFSPIFYEAYQATYSLEKGFQERMEIYQLYYLMVHVNLFGGSYIGSVNSILNKFSN